MAFIPNNVADSWYRAPPPLESAIDAPDRSSPSPFPGASARRPARVPWRDRAGRFAPFKAAVFVALFLPGLDLFYDYFRGALGARPLNELIHGTGLWAIRLLLISLAITPLRQILRRPELVTIRRMIGVGAFAYAALHFALFIVDSNFRPWFIVSEIVLRLYLTIGFVTFLALLALALTSTDAMVRRLGGKRWQQLHWAVYPAGVLAVAHHLMQTKLNVAEATVYAGLFAWLMGYRLLARGSGAMPGVLKLALLALSVTALTVGGEALGFGLFTGIDWRRVLQANWVLIGERPGWIVLFVAAAVTLLAACRPLWTRSSSSRRSPS
jgi:sulfoxide reductase heme-binding subunit YedZ